MDFANERWVRLYIRETTTWLRLGFEGQAILPQVLRFVDRSGVLETGDLPAGEAVWLRLPSWPREVVENGIARMIELAVVEHRGDRLVWPNYLDAQEMAKSDAQRARESRERRRDTKRDADVTKPDPIASHIVTKTSHAVTDGHGVSQRVTPSYPIRDEPTEPTEPTEPEETKKKIPPCAPRSPVTVTENCGVATWQAYSASYSLRYGTEPTRNAKVNGMIARFVERVPADEAPAIAAFYVGHPGALYVSSAHCVDLLLRDAEKLRTEWSTNTRITTAQARQGDKTAGNAALRMLVREGRI